MSTAFSFFLRLFLCFVAARFLLQAIGVEGRDYLVGLTLLFLVNVYWFSYLVFRDRTAPRWRLDATRPAARWPRLLRRRSPRSSRRRPGPDGGLRSSRFVQSSKFKAQGSRFGYI